MHPYKLKGTAGSVINRSFPVGDSLLLGSSPECQVQIEEPGVAPRHAEIRLVEGKSLWLKDLGSGLGTLLNGESVGETELGSGDEIRVGTCRLMLQAPGLRPDRILTAEAVGQPVRRWPRILVWTLLLLMTATVAVLKWKPAWLPAWFG